MHLTFNTMPIPTVARLARERKIITLLSTFHYNVSKLKIELQLASCSAERETHALDWRQPVNSSNLHRLRPMQLTSRVRPRLTQRICSVERSPRTCLRRQTIFHSSRRWTWWHVNTEIDRLMSLTAWHLRRARLIAFHRETLSDVVHKQLQIIEWSLSLPSPFASLALVAAHAYSSPSVLFVVSRESGERERASTSR